MEMSSFCVSHPGYIIFVFPMKGTLWGALPFWCERWPDSKGR
nr:MAG TPA: hypothetical protein [Caudoviricetes sp.]